MSGLREDLDRALRALPVSEAPVERARRDGRRRRARRRVAVLAGTAAVAVVAVGVPLLGRGAAAPPGPAISQDPVVTYAPPGDTTQAPGGLADAAGAAGAVAHGTIGAASWQVSVHAASAGSSASCVEVTTGGKIQVATDCGIVRSMAAGLGGDPASFSTLGATVGPAQAGVVVGVVSANVTYFIVTFTDGQQLKLLPVTTGGHRFVAWAAPASMTMASIVAHLGGPYSDSGQTATAVPFYQAPAVPVFGLWQRTGQTAPPRATQVIGTGTDGGHTWKVTAYEGPWGTCVLVTDGGGSVCVRAARLDTTEVLGGFGPSGTPVPAWGSAAPGVATVRIALSNGTTVEAHPVRIGNEDMFAFWPGLGVSPKSWTADNASGQEVGHGTVKL